MPNKIKYLQLELAPFCYWREINSLQVIQDWYKHLVTNPRRDHPFKFVSRFPKFLKSKKYCGEYAVLDLENNRFLTKKEMLSK